MPVGSAKVPLASENFTGQKGWKALFFGGCTRPTPVRDGHHKVVHPTGKKQVEPASHGAGVEVRINRIALSVAEKIPE